MPAFTKGTSGRLLAVSACLGLSWFALGCDDEEDNQQCESSCASHYASAVDDCEEQTASCMEDCSSPDDTSCMWDCEDYESECSFEMIMCMSGCPCIESSQSCISRCDYEDTECLMECSEHYLDCAGADSPYNCVNLCSPTKTGCVWDCEDSAADMDEYLACRADCHQEFTGCLDGCV